MHIAVDFHTHVLPGIDDGSQSVAESLQMLRKEAEQGVHTVVATPHFYAHRTAPRQFLQERQEAEVRLRAALAGDPGLPAVVMGAEVHFYEGISDSECLRDLSIAGTEYILIEMPDPPWPERRLRELADIRQKQDLTPIVAHLDRYVRFPFYSRLFEALAPLPVLIQTNAGFFTGWKTRQAALRLLRRGQIHLIGSDCHNLTSRPPDVGLAARVIENGAGMAAIEKINARSLDILKKIG